MAKRKNLFRLTFWPLRTWRIEARRCYNAREKAKFLKIIWLKLTKKRHHNAWKKRVPVWKSTSVSRCWLRRAMRTRHRYAIEQIS